MRIWDNGPDTNRLHCANTHTIYPVTGYLHILNQLLATALARQPRARLARHAEYIARRQNPDGGFSGRQGESDLYYTAFALRALIILNALTPDRAAAAGQFLRASLTSQASIVDLFSLLYGCLVAHAGGGLDILADCPADWPERTTLLFESLRTKDGGYAKAPGAASGSTYYTFLVTLCYQMLDRELPDKDHLLQFIMSRRRDDGGFVEIPPMRRSGTNPTAAGIGILQLLKQGDLATAETQPAIDFLARMPSPEGGLRANNSIPLADLLSTFTGCWTLDQLGALNRIDRPQALAYVNSLEENNGGFRAGLWDQEIDVEYTFYGLGSLALLT